MTNLPERILCIDLRKSRFGYVVLEGPHHLLDWGTREFSRRRTLTTRQVQDVLQLILTESRPEKVIVGAANDRLEMDVIPDAVKSLLVSQKIPIRIVTRSELRKRFAGMKKDLTAKAICLRFAELEPRLPDHPRRTYDNEPRSMAIFDAAALGLVYFQRKRS